MIIYTCIHKYSEKYILDISHFNVFFFSRNLCCFYTLVVINNAEVNFGIQMPSVLNVHMAICCVLAWLIFHLGFLICYFTIVFTKYHKQGNS